MRLPGHSRTTSPSCRTFSSTVPGHRFRNESEALTMSADPVSGDSPSLPSTVRLTLPDLQLSPARAVNRHAAAVPRSRRRIWTTDLRPGGATTKRPAKSDYLQNVLRRPENRGDLAQYGDQEAGSSAYTAFRRLGPHLALLHSGIQITGEETPNTSTTAVRIQSAQFGSAAASPEAATAKPPRGPQVAADNSGGRHPIVHPSLRAVAR